MRRTLVILMLALLLRPGPLSAAERPEEVLSRLLASDFAGDCVPRHGKVLYTDGKAMLGVEEGGCDCGGEPRENFDPYSDPLIVVSGWRVVGTRMETRAKAVVTVRYHVLATAEGLYWDRKILPLAPPRDEDVTYRVWRRRGRWLWVDPPDLPRVGPEAVMAAVRREIALEEKLLRRVSDRPDLPGKIALYKGQLAVLEALPAAQ